VSLKLLALFCVASLLTCSADARAHKVAHLYVKLRADALPDSASTFAAHGVVRYVPFDVPGWFRLRVTADRVSDVQSALSHDPRVLAVEGEHRLRAALTPDDPYWSSQWGAAKIGAPAAWNVTTGSPNVVVAVLDSGIDVDHPDLASQLWVNPGEVADNGLDDDGNGKVDDVNGWRFNHVGGMPDESNNVGDEYGHGTHVSGIVGAAGNNGLGVAGMTWGSSLMTIRVLDAGGDGWYSDVAAGVVYAVDNGARVINLSLGGTDDDVLLRDAIAYAHAQGVLVAAAAGNFPDCAYGSLLYPAPYDPAIAVAASTSGDQQASFSCHGPEVDLTAPGEAIYSTGMSGGYYSSSGTSMATPYVSGLAALIWSWQPTMTITQVTQLMIDAAVDIESAGWDQYTGWGRIDAESAVVVEEVPEVDLQLSKDVEPAGPLHPGDAITYTLVYTNAGWGIARDVVITDGVPVSLTNVSYTATGAAITATAGVTYVWQVEDLASGEGGTITITADLAADLVPCTVTNTATITGTVDDRAGNNSDRVAVVVEEAPGMDVYLPLVLRSYERLGAFPLHVGNVIPMRVSSTRGRSFTARR
jgi:uncharacterized repeat protein (TIGR01451 family)